MQKWEYNIAYREWLTEKEMNELGEQGWELVSMMPIDMRSDLKGYAYFFKRPKS